MHTLEVGKPYIPGRTNWSEGSEYNYRGGAHELRLFFRDPSPAEINSVASGEASFALAFERNILFFLYWFAPEIAWSDAPFTPHLVPADQRAEPPTLAESERALLSIVLIDAVSGIVKALRTVSLSHQMSIKLHEHIRRQMTLPFSLTQYDADLAAVQAKYTSMHLRHRAFAASHVPGASN